MKKTILFYGNCHLSAISNWIYKCYSDKFKIIKFEYGSAKNDPGNKNFAVWQDSLDRQKEYYKYVHEKIKEADFFVFQAIEHKAIPELQTEYLIDNVVNGKSICVPNTRFFSYPVCYISLSPHVKYIYKNITKEKDKIIEYLLKENDPKFKEILFESYKSCITENKRRYISHSLNCKNKIDMGDFIENNWKKHLLFGTHNHPIGVYWNELLSKLFKHLDEELDLQKIDELFYPNKDGILNVMEFEYFKNSFPDIIIPKEISHLVEIHKAESYKFPRHIIVREPLAKYYA